MAKRIFTCIMAGICLCSVYFLNKTPIFSGYAESYELYIASASSSAKIITVSEKIFPFVFNVKGQAITIDKKDFDLTAFLNEFNANIVASDSFACGIVYYAYSPKIKYKKKVGEHTVNLQIYLGEQVKIGSPIIFGSF
jgi:hypothetical protein